MNATNRYGPADVTCPYCAENIHVEAGPTKLCEITHCSDRWIIVDLEAEKAGHTSKRVATDGGHLPSDIWQETDLTKQTVNEGLRQLIAAGWVKKVVRGLYDFNEDPREDGEE